MDAKLCLLIGAAGVVLAWRAYRLGVQTERRWWAERTHYR
jgi:hypothetical protein